MPEATDLRVPVQARAQRTRAALLAAAEADFGARGYAGATARSIAERAGVATGSFYQYFVDKDAALRAVAEQRLQTLEQALLSLATPRSANTPPALSTPKDAVLGIIDTVVAYHQQDRALHAVLTERRHADPALDALTHGSEQRFVADIERTLRALGQHGELTARAFMLFGLIEGTVHAHVLGTPLLSDAEFRDALCDAVLAIAALRDATVSRRAAAEKPTAEKLPTKRAPRTR